MNILVVDDDASVRAAVQAAIVARGHTPLCFADSESALKAVYFEQTHGGQVAFAIIDWVLPGMDGIALTRLLRSLPQGDSLWILALSGRSSPADLGALLSAGASDYLAKPLDLALLNTRLMVGERAAQLAIERRELDYSLARSRSEWLRIFDALTVGVAIVRGEGPPTYANAALARMLGFDSTAQVLGRPLSQLAVAEDVASLQAVLSLAPAATMKQPFECRFNDPMNGVRRLELSLAHTIELSGGPALVLLARDVTELRNLQARMAISDRVVAMGGLAAGIGHEINNPLAYVVANLGYMAESFHELPVEHSSSQVTTEFAEALAEARQGAERMRQIVRDLKALS